MSGDDKPLLDSSSESEEESLTISSRESEGEPLPASPGESKKEPLASIFSESEEGASVTSPDRPEEEIIKFSDEEGPASFSMERLDKFKSVSGEAKSASGGGPRRRKVRKISKTIHKSRKCMSCYTDSEDSDSDDEKLVRLERRALIKLLTKKKKHCFPWCPSWINCENLGAVAHVIHLMVIILVLYKTN